ncbi:hypothetical protein PENTCL1PPCAC_18703, partial [Pristionchus entomophagus]
FKIMRRRHVPTAKEENAVSNNPAQNIPAKTTKRDTRSAPPTKERGCAKLGKVFDGVILTFFDVFGGRRRKEGPPNQFFDKFPYGSRRRFSAPSHSVSHDPAKAEHDGKSSSWTYDDVSIIVMSVGVMVVSTICFIGIAMFLMETIYRYAHGYKKGNLFNVQ